MLDVTCVGILVADTIARTVDGLPERGKLQLIEKIGLYTGGCAVKRLHRHVQTGHEDGDYRENRERRLWEIHVRGAEG